MDPDVPDSGIRLFETRVCYAGLARAVVGSGYRCSSRAIPSQGSEYETVASPGDRSAKRVRHNAWTRTLAARCARADRICSAIRKADVGR